MNRLVWKELREHFKLALVAMLGLGAAELNALFENPNGSGYLDNHGVTLMRDSLLLITTFGSAAVGLLLGFLQISPELKRDRWAALLHLPTPRSHLFFGKAVAGVILYALATVPPFLTCVYLAATPGHFLGPFLPGLALPGIADTLTGLTFYFAALLMALQRGGGFALRALPFFAAVHVTSFVHETNEFQLAAWAAVLMAACMYAAGSGAMVHRDHWSARPWLTRVALLTVAFYGLCGVGNLFRQAADAGNNFKFDGISYEFADDDSRPLKLTYQKSVVVSVQELDGSTPKESNYRPDEVRSHTRHLNPFIPPRNRFAPSAPYRVVNTYLSASQSFSHPQPELWFQIIEPPYLIGFSQRTKKPIAIFDENGFHPASSPPVPFPAGVYVESSGSYGFCLWSSDRVRMVDLPGRKVTEISLPVSGPVSSMTHALSNATPHTVQTTALQLPTGVAFYDESSGQLVTTIPYHHDITRFGALCVGTSSALDRFYLWYRPTYDAEVQSHNTLPSYLEVSDAQGKVLQTYTLPPLPRREFSISQFRKLTAYGQSLAFYFGSLLYHQIGIGLGSEHLRWELNRGVFNHQLQPQHAVWGIIPLSLLCAAATLALARHAQFTWKQAFGWAGLALVLNIAGLILFRLIADRPRVLPCAACQRRRPITQSACPHCAEGWPAIAPTGAEIFDPIDVSPSPSAATV